MPHSLGSGSRRLDVYAKLGVAARPYSTHHIHGREVLNKKLLPAAFSRKGPVKHSKTGFFSLNRCVFSVRCVPRKSEAGPSGGFYLEIPRH